MIKPCRALKTFNSTKPNLYNSFRNSAEQAAKSVSSVTSVVK